MEPGSISLTAPMGKIYPLPFPPLLSSPLLKIQFYLVFPSISDPILFMSVFLCLWGLMSVIQLQSEGQPLIQYHWEHPETCHVLQLDLSVDIKRLVSCDLHEKGRMKEKNRHQITTAETSAAAEAQKDSQNKDFAYLKGVRNLKINTVILKAFFWEEWLNSREQRVSHWLVFADSTVCANCKIKRTVLLSLICRTYVCYKGVFPQYLFEEVW